MTVLKLGSLFDGIGVFPLAAVHCGMEPVWASEIEARPISITRRHFPDMHCGAHLDPDEHCDCLARVRGKKIRTGNCRIHGTMGRTRYARDRT